MVRNGCRLLRRGLRLLARVDVAAALILAVLLLAGFGSWFPQLSPAVAADPERLAQWEAAVRARYGARVDLMASLGAFRFFGSPLFLAPLLLLLLATLVCTLERWRGVWRRGFGRSVRCQAEVLAAAPHTATVHAAPGANVLPLVREGLRERGFRVRSETTAGATHLLGERNRLASVATLATHLAVLLMAAGVLATSWWGWREEIEIGPGEAAGIGHGSALAVRNDSFAITRYADGSAAGYEAGVSILAQDGAVRRGILRLNAPLALGDVQLVLQGYAESEVGYRLSLLAVHDPGYGLVVAAGLVLFFGLTLSLSFPHCWVRVRVEPGGALRVAGRADRHAWDMEREFGALVESLDRAAGVG